MEKRKLIVGIDPGKKGAIAFLDIETDEAFVVDMPSNEEDIIPMLEDVRFVAIEKQCLIPKRKGNYEILVHYGILLGILKSLRIPYEEIPAPRWQKVMLGNGKRTRKKSKERSLQKARSLFPYVDFGNKDGRSDALLIAEYARRVRYK